MPYEENEALSENENDNEDIKEEVITMAGDTTTVGRLKRSALLHYINTAFSTSLTGAAWKVIGKDVEDLSVELNPSTETIKNILDETSIVDTGYEPSFDIDTYYADPSDGELYTKLKDIAMNRKTGDDCRTLILEVLIDKTTGGYDAWVEEAVIKPTSYGGAQGGVRIPCSATFCGNRQQGTVTITDKVPAFTPAT